MALTFFYACTKVTARLDSLPGGGMQIGTVSSSPGSIMNTTDERRHDQLMSECEQMEAHIPGTRGMAQTATPRQTASNAIYTLQTYAILWSVTLTVMLIDDAAMLALAFC